MQHFFFLTIIFFVSFQTQAQFYTITRDTPIEQKRTVQTVEPQVIEEPFNPADTIPAIEVDETEKIAYPYANARKRNVRRRVKIERKESNLPKLTIANLIREIKKNELKHPEIVLAQAILETGWFTSNVCKTKNNLFGLTNPRTKTYYEFDHWTESVRAYYTKVQYRYKGGNYLYWLRDIGYAENPGYISAVVSVIKTLRRQSAQGSENNNAKKIKVTEPISKEDYE